MRLSALILSPFIPKTCQRIFSQIGINEKIDDMDISKDGQWGKFRGGVKIGKREILFPRIKEK